MLASAIKVSPLESLDLNLNIDNLPDLSEVDVVSISVLDENKKLIGEIADAAVRAEKVVSQSALDQCGDRVQAVYTRRVEQSNKLPKQSSVLF